MSWKIEVQADSTGTWAGNGLRFETEYEAELYGKDLANRWTLVTAVRQVESDEPVTHKIDEDDHGYTMRRVEEPAAT